ncbi:LysR substrate-binding domain-containing protein [Paragemmobacter straminiformis]|uniref:LysR family transcriptional regulator n=1 Tax=Paragemmobacter straminiformis TaxID=2045119 RepID=A0A842I8F2_9RHOB|nr:LysR substrate-binding domain-containing protein [Gemmobacter straminiformis]MBC2835915.1 LysR family transcriptional regulator [Gemmobacter straminiformis]
MADFLPLTALRAFEAVVRTGSFKAAADQLYVTQSAVSHQIRHLEEWFGTPLFTRDGNRPKPLPFAEELASTLSLSFSQISAACQRARAVNTIQPLVVAAIPSIALLWLIPRLAGFRAAHPDIDVRIVYALHGRDIDFRDVHMAFAFSKGGASLPGARIEPFLPGHCVPVCSPALARQIATADDTPSAIAKLGLLHDTDHTGWKEWFDRAKAAQPAPTTGPIFEDFNLLRAAALSGQGVALCPLAMVRADIEAQRLVRLSDVMVLEDTGYFLLWGPPGPAQMQARARAFRDWAFTERSLQDWSLS